MPVHEVKHRRKFAMTLMRAPATADMGGHPSPRVVIDVEAEQPSAYAIAPPAAGRLELRPREIPGLILRLQHAYDEHQARSEALSVTWLSDGDNTPKNDQGRR